MMDMFKSPLFIDHKAVSAAPDTYIELEVNVAQILKSWRSSLFSFEWLQSDGAVKAPELLKDKDQQRYHAVVKALSDGQPLVKPVLGIGIQDHVEIGLGKDVLLVLAAQGADVIPVHVLRSDESDFQKYCTSV